MLVNLFYSLLKSGLRFTALPNLAMPPLDMDV